jgi:hypothetical protein
MEDIPNEISLETAAEETLEIVGIHLDWWVEFKRAYGWMGGVENL